MSNQLTEGTVTILFTDVEGSTALHAAKGDAEARAILSGCDELVRQQVEAHGGRAVKSLGDGLMAIFTSSRRAVACALAIQEAMTKSGHGHAQHRVRLRAGLHTGEATEEAGDFFGAAVNAAARICAKAEGGEVLASDVVRQLCGALPGAIFSDRGRVVLKGFPGRWHLYRLIPLAASDVARGDLPSEPRLHGRGRELEALDACLRLALVGRDQLAFVEGEGGIGKTRLVTEVLAAAEARGFRVFRGRSEELERNRPFGPLADALGCQRRAPDAERAAIGRLLTVEGDDEVGDSGASQFRVTEAFVELVEGLVAAGPVALALEDLQWADPSTLLALRTLSRRLGHLPVVLVGTLRPSPRRAEVDRLVDACVAEGGLHLRLGPLDEAAVISLVAEAVGAEPGSRLRREVAGAGGNPFFVLELTRALCEEGALDVTEGRAEVAEVGLSATLRLTILRRLVGLPETTFDLLRLASILGSTLSVADLSVVSRRSAVDVLSGLQEAMRAGFLGEAGNQLAFRHDLVREALYHDIPASARAALHREAGRALAEAGARAVQVATHLGLAAAPGDAEAVEWLQRAANEVGARSSGVATELLERAVELVEPADAKRDDLLTTLTAVLIRSGRVREGAALAREVLGRRHDPAVEGFLRVTLSSGLIGLGRAEEAIAVAEPPPDLALTEAEKVQLQANACFARLWTGAVDRAAADGAVVRNAAERLGHDLAWCFATSALSLASMFRGELENALALASEVVERTEQGSSRSSPQAWPVALFPSHYWLAVCLIEADRLEAAGRVIEAGRRFCGELGNPAFLPRMQWVSALRRYLVGEWDDARADAEAGMAMLGEGGARQGAAYGHSILALIGLYRGDFEEVEERLGAAEREVATAGPQYRVHWPVWVRGLLHEARGETDQALRCLEAAWARASGLGFLCERPGLGPDLVRLALDAGALERARVVTEAVEEAAARMGVASATGAALRCRGVLEDNPELLLKAVETCRAGRRPRDRALACEDAAVVLAKGGRLAESQSLLDEALDLYGASGARYELDRAAARLRTLGVRRGRRGPRKRPSTGWEALTPTELRVVKLAVEGMTNSQIGKRLFISHYTVATHLAHVFAKLGVSSRVELAAKVAGRR